MVGDSYLILSLSHTQQDTMSIKTFEVMAGIILTVAPMFGQYQTSSKQIKVSLSSNCSCEIFAHTTRTKKTTGPPKILIYSMIIENLKNLWGNILLISDT